MTRIELVTSSLPRKRSTPELHRRKVFSFLLFLIRFLPSQEFRARDRVRTGDIQLGRLTLYQLSYSRILRMSLIKGFQYFKFSYFSGLPCFARLSWIGDPIHTILKRSFTKATFKNHSCLIGLPRYAR